MVTAAMKFKDSLLLGSKAMTNLDSILKSRDITLPTKVRLVKAMVFPVVIYGCESWTIKKAGAGALGRPRGMVWGGRREEGGGFRMGNTCIPVADSF